MAEQLLSEDKSDWGTEMEVVQPDGGNPHPGVWMDDVQRRLREDLIMQEQVEVVGDAQVTATMESTEDLAVSPEQVKTTFTCLSSNLCLTLICCRQRLPRPQRSSLQSRNWQGRRRKPTWQKGGSSGANCRQQPRM